MIVWQPLGRPGRCAHGRQGVERPAGQDVRRLRPGRGGPDARTHGGYRRPDRLCRADRGPLSAAHRRGVLQGHPVRHSHRARPFDLRFRGWPGRHDGLLRQCDRGAGGGSQPARDEARRTGRHGEGARRSGGAEQRHQSQVRDRHRELLGSESARRGSDGLPAGHAGAPALDVRVSGMDEAWPLKLDAGASNDPVFVGVGELPSGRFPDRGFVEGLTRVAMLALKDAGMAPRDADTIMLIPNLHSFTDQADLIFSRMVEELGIAGQAKASFMMHSGGSTSDNAVRVASGLIASGHARTILVLQGERWGSADVKEMITMLSKYGIPGEWELPTGLQFNAIGALITRRYMV